MGRSGGLYRGLHQRHGGRVYRQALQPGDGFWQVYGSACRQNPGALRYVLVHRGRANARMAGRDRAVS